MVACWVFSVGARTLRRCSTYKAINKGRKGGGTRPDPMVENKGLARMAALQTAKRRVLILLLPKSVPKAL